MADAVGCGAKCAKYILIIFNFIVWLSGAGLLGVGIWMLVDADISQKLEIFGEMAEDATLMRYAAYILIAVGGFVFFLGFCGCCGAITLSKCLLVIYMISLVFVMAAEIAGGALSYVKIDVIIEEVELEGIEYVKNYGSGTGNTTVPLVDFIQQGFGCCGIQDPNDWKTSDLYTIENQNCPWSCCSQKPGTKLNFWEIKPNEVETCYTEFQPSSPWVPPTDNFYTTGCIDGVDKWIREKSVIIVGVGFGMACLEIFGFIFALCLCRNIADDGEKV